MGVFEDEEVVSGWICGNPVGKLAGLCMFGVNKLNGLFLYIQPLWHKIHEQAFVIAQVTHNNFLSILLTLITLFQK